MISSCKCCIGCKKLGGNNRFVLNQNNLATVCWASTWEVELKLPNPIFLEQEERKVLKLWNSNNLKMVKKTHRKLACKSWQRKLNQAHLTGGYTWDEEWELCTERDCQQLFWKRFRIFWKYTDKKVFPCEVISSFCITLTLLSGKFGLFQTHLKIFLYSMCRLRCFEQLLLHQIGTSSK